MRACMLGVDCRYASLFWSMGRSLSISNNPQLTGPLPETIADLTEIR